MRAQFVRYPFMQVQDVYKLVFQAVFGSEHAVIDSQSARKWLEQEIEQLGPGPNEPVIDPIAAEGQVVRVHLRPFLAEGGDPETLLDAFIRSGKEIHGDAQTFASYWMVARQTGHFSQAEMDAYYETKRTEGFPAVHHSPVYAAAYCPAYRVVAWRMLEMLSTPPPAGRFQRSS